MRAFFFFEPFQSSNTTAKEVLRNAILFFFLTWDSHRLLENAYSIVYNDNEMFVGQVLSNGITVSFVGPVEAPLVLCIRVREDILVSPSVRFDPTTPSSPIFFLRLYF